MSKKKLLWVAIPLAVLLGVGAAGAGYKNHRGHHNAGYVVEKISERLELNSEQREKLEAVKEALMQSRSQMREERKELMNQIIAQVQEAEMDQARVMELIEKRMSRIDGMAQRVVGPIIEFHKSLNQVQREKIVNRLESLRDWGGGRWHG